MAIGSYIGAPEDEPGYWDDKHPNDDDPEGGPIVAAMRDAEGWVLFDASGDPVDWPADWPNEVDAGFLNAQGIEIAV